MLYQSTLTNDQGCEFDMLTLVFPRSPKACAAALKTAKQWATLRGGRYTLRVCEYIGDGLCDTIGEFDYSGKCRKASTASR